MLILSSKSSFFFLRYAAGLTLKQVVLESLTTAKSDDHEKEIFGKKVTIESFAVYWQPVRSSKGMYFLKANNIH